jgi:dipeptidyl aminopeptidase/acylaminoacyl peptidase
MAYGGRDTRVPLDHGTDMRNALQPAGKTYEWMSFPGEEHGLVFEENRIKLFTDVEAFLQKYNPAEPSR